MNLSEEHLEKIEKEAKMFCQQNGIKYPKSYYPGTKIVVKHLIKFVLSEPELLSKAGWVKKEEWISVEDSPKESGMYLCYDINTPSRNKCEIYYYSKHKNDWSIGMDTYHPQYWQPLPSPPQNK